MMKENSNRLTIHIQSQQLCHYQNDKLVKTYPVSTAKKGIGNQLGSEQTPLGKHQICAKIGEGQPVNTVFVGRQPTGEYYSPELRQQHPDRDWILTRILWLDGLEEKVNKLGEVDTKLRYIYIHGMPDEDPLGVPGSRGCIRMRNDDLIELFAKVDLYDRVEIFQE